MISALDLEGNLVWRKVIDAQKVTRRAGAKRDPRTGEMVPFSKAFNRLKLQYLLRLRDGSYVALGKDDARVAVVRFDSKGMILENDRYDLGRTVIDAAIATEDGGFAMVARRGLRFIKFDAQGNVLFRRDLSDHRRQIYSHAIVKTPQGYLIGSSVGEDAQMQLLQIDRKGHKLDLHRYAKKGVRLHPRFLVESPDHDYLLVVNTEIFESWIVHVGSDGVIKANLDDPTRYDRLRYSPGKEIEENISVGDRLPAHTPLSAERAAPLKIVTVKTRSFLGGAIRKMILSKNRQRLYAITGGTGFKIFQKNSDGNWNEVGNILRTRSKLVVKPHYIGPEDGKPPKHGTAYDYDAPYDIWIDKNERRAYISDSVHGFYCVDISAASHPVIRYAAPKLKLHYFVLSPDEREILFYARGRLQRLSLQKIKDEKDHLSIIDGDGRQHLVALDDRKKVLVSDRNFLMLYESSTGRLIGQQNVGTGAYISKLYSDGNRHIVIETGRGEIKIFKLDEKNLFQQVTSVHHQNFLHDCLLFPKKKRLCVADKEGVLCIGYRDPLNPQPLIRYRDKALNGADAVATDRKMKTLLIAFYHESLGESALDP
jgi:hypothetical protein